jgi:hypothetical protein
LPAEPPAPISSGLQQTTEAYGLQAAGTVISLEERAEKVAGPLAEREQDMREMVANHIIPAFKVINVATAVAVVVLAFLDQWNIVFGHIVPAGRVVTPQVIIALLSATAIQLGSIAVIIARYLFTRTKP